MGDLNAGQCCVFPDFCFFLLIFWSWDGKTIGVYLMLVNICLYATLFWRSTCALALKLAALDCSIVCVSNHQSLNEISQKKRKKV